MARILMIANDTWIDRRILAEAESLIDAGHDVHLIAGHIASDRNMPLKETIGRVKVERVPWGGFTGFLLPVVRFGQRVYKGLRQFCGIPDQVPAIGMSSRAATGESEKPAGIAEKSGTPQLGFVRRIVKNVLYGIATCIYGVLRGIDHLGQYTTRERLILKIILRQPPDIVHVHDLPLLRLGVAAKKKLGVPLVYDAHELFPHQPRITKRQRRHYSRLESRYIYDADKVITVNDLCAQAMQDEYPGVKVTTIQNAVDPPAGFDLEARHDLFRQELGLAPDTVLFLYQGGIMSERNLENLIRGMHHVSDPRRLLLLMGYGDYWSTLTQIIRDEGLENRVIYIPAKPQTELLYYTASADVGIIPYPYGADLNTHLVSPNKLYEYIVAGLPMLSNLLPFVKQVVEEHEIGICRDLQSESNCAAAIDAFPLDQLKQFRLNLDVARDRFTWKSESKRLLSLYASIFEESEHRAADMQRTNHTK